MTLDEQIRTKNLKNKRFMHQDFSGKDLTNCDFRSSSLIECNFNDAILDHATLEGANCFGSRFENTRLHKTNFKDAILARTIMLPRDCTGVTLTLSCDTVDRMQINDMWFSAYLYLALMMKGPSDEQRAHIIAAVGKNAYERFQTVFRERV